MKKLILVSFMILSSYSQAVTVAMVNSKGTVSGSNKVQAVANATSKLITKCNNFGATVDVYNIKFDETNSRMVGQSVTATVEALCVK